MTKLSAKNHRCRNCGASLDLELVREDIARCCFCGSDHKLVSAAAAAEDEVRAERRMGGLIAPFLCAPLIGFFGLLAARDFWWSAYGGVPVRLVGVTFIVVGLMRFRISAALGLAIVGVAGILKPFVRPIPSTWNDGFFSPPRRQASTISYRASSHWSSPSSSSPV